MQLRRCTNTECQRPYQIKKSEGPTEAFRSGKLNCPHCDHVEALWEDDAFSLQPLTEEQEAVFNKQRLGEFLSRYRWKLVGHKLASLQRS